MFLLGRSFVEDANIYSGFIDITQSENSGRNGGAIYYVTFAPYSAEKVTGSDHPAEIFLSRFRLGRDAVESAIRELSTSRRTFIPNVRLSPRDLRWLRPA